MAEFVIEREALLGALQPMQGIVEKRQTMAVLSNVLCSFKSDLVAITGTDLEIELTTFAKVEESSENYDITVPAKKLIDICRGLPEGAKLRFAFEENKLKLSSNRSRYTLATLPAAEFPQTDEGPDNTEFSLNESALIGLLQKTSFAMAQQDVRYYLNGLLFEIEQDKLTLVASDGHRLAMNQTAMPIGVEEKQQVILPRKAIMEIMRLLGDNDRALSVSLAQNRFTLQTDTMIFRSKLIDGRFPDYRRLIPSTTAKEFTVSRDNFKEALNRAAILSNEKIKGVHLYLSEHLLKIVSSNTQHELGEEEIEVVYQGEAMDIGVNVIYFLDVLNVLGGDICVSLTDSNSSILITDSRSEQSAYVIMPMRL